MGEALTEEAALAKLRAFREQPKEEVKNEEVQTNAEGQGQETEILTPDESQKPAEETAQDVSEPAQGTEQSDVETVELDVEQLSSILGIEPDYLEVDDSGKINFKTNIDGQQGKTTLKDAIKNYQTDTYLTKKGQEIQKLEEQRKQELSEFVSKTQSFAQQAATILENLKQAYVQPMSEAELKELRENDPAEYAARKEELRERESRFANMAAQSLRQIEEAQKAQSEEMQRQYNAYLAEQETILKRNVPEIEKEWPNVIKYAESVGYPAQSLQQAASAPFFTIMYKAMMYDKGTTAVKQKLQKPIPKTIKASPRVDKGQIKMEELAKLKAELKKTGSPEAAMALLKAQRK